MKVITILFVFISSILSAQFTLDAERLMKLEYMEKYSRKINCDSTTGSNLEHKICLNKQFQKVDSLLNASYIESLQFVESDSLKKEFKKIQTQWIKNRHTQAVIRSSNFKGHLLGIKYLSYMLLATQNRIQELKSLTFD